MTKESLGKEEEKSRVLLWCPFGEVLVLPIKSKIQRAYIDQEYEGRSKEKGFKGESHHHQCMLWCKLFIILIDQWFSPNVCVDYARCLDLIIWMVNKIRYERYWLFLTLEKEENWYCLLLVCRGEVTWVGDRTSDLH